MAVTSLWAVVLNIWGDNPVYHAHGRIEGQGLEYTKCGRLIRQPFLPLKHAKKFARPCKGCFGA